MWLFIGLVLAGSLGAVGPYLSPKRPLLGLAIVVVVPPLLLLWRYLAFVAEGDGEGMGATALSLAAAAWIVVTLAAGALSLRASRAR